MIPVALKSQWLKPPHAESAKVTGGTIVADGALDSQYLPLIGDKRRQTRCDVPLDKHTATPSHEVAHIQEDFVLVKDDSNDNSEHIQRSSWCMRGETNVIMLDDDPVDYNDLDEADDDVALSDSFKNPDIVVIPDRVVRETVSQDSTVLSSRSEISFFDQLGRI